MTMNERLFAFDLFERYETSRTQDGKAMVLRKVDHADGPESVDLLMFLVARYP